MRYLLMIGLRGSDSCCNFYTTMYIYLLRKSLKNKIAKYSYVKDKIRDSIKKNPHQKCRFVSYIFHNIDLCNNIYYIYYNDM